MTFAPRIVPSVAALLAIAVTIRLGLWQVDRYFESTALATHIHGQWAAEPLTDVPANLDSVEHRRATLSGTYVPAPHAMSAGGLVGGVPGYRWVLPFRLDDGRTLLVDRGWVPVDITADALQALLPAGRVTVSGLLAEAVETTRLTPSADVGLERWPLDGDRLLGVLPRVLGPPYGAIARARGVDLPLVVRAGDARDEERLDPAPLPITGYALPLPKIHHRSYAAQWFAIAGLAFCLWLWSSVRRPARVIGAAESDH